MTPLSEEESFVGPNRCNSFSLTILKLRRLGRWCETFKISNKNQRRMRSSSFAEMNDGFSRCGNKFPPKEVIKVYFYRLSPAFNSWVQRFRATHERCIYMEMVQQGKSKKEVFRIRTALLSREPIPKTTPIKQTLPPNWSQFRTASNYEHNLLSMKMQRPMCGMTTTSRARSLHQSYIS